MRFVPFISGKFLRGLLLLAVAAGLFWGLPLMVTDAMAINEGGFEGFAIWLGLVLARGPIAILCATAGVWLVVSALTD